MTLNELRARLLADFNRLTEAQQAKFAAMYPEGAERLEGERLSDAIGVVRRTLDKAKADAVEVNTHNMIIQFGRHKGTPWTQVPVSYLKYLVNVKSESAYIAAAELKRRGTTTPDLDVSGHAIDRLSLNARGVWHQHRGSDEGIHAFLCRVAREALDERRIDAKGRYHHLGLRFVFQFEGAWPVLKTVIPAKQHHIDNPPPRSVIAEALADAERNKKAPMTSEEREGLREVLAEAIKRDAPVSSGAVKAADRDPEDKGF